MKRLFLLVNLLFFSISFSQDFKQDQRVWLAYTGFFKMSNHWSYQAEAQFRMDNQLQQNHQNLFRVGTLYSISTSKNIAAGYALVHTFSNSLEEYFKENRLWEQFQYSKKWHNDENLFLHRIRLEQRWVEKKGPVNNEIKSITTNYQNRLRYFNRNLFHVCNFVSENASLYAIIQDEVFFTFGDNNINTKLIDQNRFLVGLGLNFKSNTRFELGYLNIYVTSPSQTDTMYHTISISVSQNLAL
jgi:hypothetical protein